MIKSTVSRALAPLLLLLATLLIAVPDASHAQGRVNMGAVEIGLNQLTRALRRASVAGDTGATYRALVTYGGGSVFEKGGVQALSEAWAADDAYVQQIVMSRGPEFVAMLEMATGHVAGAEGPTRSVMESVSRGIEANRPAMRMCGTGNPNDGQLESIVSVLEASGGAIGAPSAGVDGAANAVAGNGAVDYPRARDELNRLMVQAATRRPDYREARVLMFDMYRNENGDIWDVYGEVWITQGQNGNRGFGSIPDHNQINTEHLYPRSRKKNGMADWGGRRPDTRPPTYGDLYNLLPTNSRLNGIRGNHALTEHGFTVDGNQWNIPDAIKGEVARRIFTFTVRHGLPLPDEMLTTLKDWHRRFPVSPEETARMEQIAEVMGYRNAFVDDPTLVDAIFP